MAKNTIAQNIARHRKAYTDAGGTLDMNPSSKQYDAIVSRAVDKRLRDTVLGEKKPYRSKDIKRKKDD